jgi:hypothetical protein
MSDNPDYEVRQLAQLDLIAPELARHAPMGKHRQIIGHGQGFASGVRHLGQSHRRASAQDQQTKISSP